MKGWNWLLAATAAIGISIDVAPAGQAQQQKGWALYQTSPHSGVWYVYLSKNGLAAVNKKIGATLVTRAPQWNVVLYNDKTKVYYLSTLSQWKGSFQSPNAKTNRFKQAAKKAVSTPPRKGKTAPIAGLMATQYITESPLQGSGAKRAEFWVTRDIEVAPQLTEILAKTYGYGLNDVHGMPLRVAYIDETGKRIPVFDTLKAQQQIIPTESFTYPPTYTQVDNEVAVFMDEKGRKAMANIMDDLGGSDGTDELSALLGTTGSTASRTPSARYSTTSGATGGRTYGMRTTSTSTTRPATTTTQSKPANNNDWFGNIMGAFGQKK
jgi:hypothetical protein